MSNAYHIGIHASLQLVLHRVDIILRHVDLRIISKRWFFFFCLSKWVLIHALKLISSSWQERALFYIKCASNVRDKRSKIYGNVHLVEWRWNYSRPDYLCVSPSAKTLHSKLNRIKQDLLFSCVRKLNIYNIVTFIFSNIVMSCNVSVKLYITTIILNKFYLA